MKKYLLGLTAVVLAISLSAFNSMSKSKSISKKTTYTYWYPVNSADRTSSTTVAYSNVDETFIINNQSCKDLTSQICFAGSNTTLALNTNVSGFAADMLVKHQ